MTTIILTALLISSLVIILTQNKKIKDLKTFIKNIPPPIPDMKIEDDPFGDSKPKHRKGLITQKWEETDSKGDKTKHTTYAEVEEIENLGTLSRIKLINITGATQRCRDAAKEQMPEIIGQDQIEFFP